MLDPTIANDTQDAATALLIAAVTFLFVVVFSTLFLRRNRRRRYRSRHASSQRDGYETDLTDVGQQLRAVMAASFEKRQLMSPSEYRVFKILENCLDEARAGYRVFAQTCLGEVLRSADSKAYRSINSKRVDILVVDRRGLPVLAVEYQGAGHYQGNAVARDAVKKEALRKAGVRYVEVTPNDSDEQIRSRVREHLNWPVAATVRRDRTQLADTSDSKLETSSGRSI